MKTAFLMDILRSMHQIIAKHMNNFGIFQARTAKKNHLKNEKEKKSESVMRSENTKCKKIIN